MRIERFVARVLIFIAGCAATCTFPGTVLGQDDTGGAFKFLPKYSPEEDGEDQLPSPPEVETPELVSRPDIRYPADPALGGRSARVYVKALVSRRGRVRDAQILTSPDSVFNRHALRYARRFRFVWPPGTTPRDSVWVAFPIDFSPEGRVRGHGPGRR